MITFNMYHKLISIHNDKKVLHELHESLMSAEIELNMILKIIWLTHRDLIINFFQETLIWREKPEDSVKNENSEELNSEVLRKKLDTECFNQIY